MPKGTYLFGGLGTDGAYADRIVDALTVAGISDAHHGDIWPWRFSKSLPAVSTIVDAMWGVFRLRSLNRNSNFDKNILTSNGIQFNLIGYSYGGLIVCQMAFALAREPNTVIDNIVLIGAPISPEQLRWIQDEKCIKNIHILNLAEFGDPVFASISFWQLILSPLKLIFQYFRKSGHFIYTGSGIGADEARKHLAENLVQLGLK